MSKSGIKSVFITIFNRTVVLRVEIDVAQLIRTIPTFFGRFDFFIFKCVLEIRMLGISV